MTSENQTWVFHDGGRRDAGFSGDTGDCVVRAVAIASELPYQQVYDRLSHGMRTQRKGKRPGRKPSARNGVSTRRKWFRDYMASIGFRWVPTMTIGTGCQVHLRADELPKGRLACKVSRHYVAVIDGVVYDTYDPTRDGTRCVYGYWEFVGMVRKPGPPLLQAKLDGLMR